MMDFPGTKHTRPEIRLQRHGEDDDGNHLQNGKEDEAKTA